MDPVNNPLTTTAVILTGKAPVVIGSLALIGAGVVTYQAFSIFARLNGYRVQTVFTKPQKK